MWIKKSHLERNAKKWEVVDLKFGGKL